MQKQTHIVSKHISVNNSDDLTICVCFCLRQEQHKHVKMGRKQHVQQDVQRNMVGSSFLFLCSGDLQIFQLIL